MADLSTKYLGLTLQNPIIVGASHFSRSAASILECEEAGAGAIVLKSIFEEQILGTVAKLEEVSQEGLAHSEAAEYLQSYGRENAVEEYIATLREAKKSVKIPIIASIHCSKPDTWLEFAKRLEDAGADALELNLFVMPSDISKSGSQNEALYFETVEQLKREVSLPISLKLGYYFSGLAEFLYRLSCTKLDGMVLFNRFRAPDFDIDNLKLIAAKTMSSPEDYIHTLRWISILSDKLKCDIAASTGIHDAKTLIKQLLAGAHAVQLCSTLYKNGLGQIKLMKQELGEWMKAKNFETIQSFRGKMSKLHSGNPAEYDRVQFMKASLSYKS